MRLSAVTVSVDYSDLLAKSIEIRKKTLDYFLVVTAQHDDNTRALCGEHGVDCYTTDAFYRNGADFNKYLAIVEAVNDWKRDNGFWSDWNLLLDADIVLPADWRQIVESRNLNPGTLYGCRRMIDDGRMLSREELAGFFQLFHASDPNAQKVPFLETNWRHAGGGDSEFQLRWPEERKKWLPLTVIHLGNTGKNWFGAGKESKMHDMLVERAKNRGVSPKERLS